jgi:type IV pilus assembly protein PilN
MRVPINLASQPFRRDRALIVASLAVAALLVLSLGGLIALALADRSQMKDVRQNIAQLNRQIAEVNKTKAETDAVLRLPQNAEVLERSVFLNTLLYRKGISWTRLLSDLEKVMPPNARVLIIRPYVTGATGKNQIALDLTVGAESPDPVIKLYKALEGSDLFGALTPVSYAGPTQSEPLYRYRFTVNYAQKL